MKNCPKTVYLLRKCFLDVDQVPQMDVLFLQCRYFAFQAQNQRLSWILSSTSNGFIFNFSLKFVHSPEDFHDFDIKASEINLERIQLIKLLIQ